MKTLIQAAVVTLSAASAAHAQQAVQWRVQDGGNGHWYAVRSWTGPIQHTNLANFVATSMGGYLATIPTVAEDNFVWTALGSPAYAVLGGFQDATSPNYSEPSGGWKWITGEDITSFCWTWNEPSNGLGNGESVLAYNYNQTWNDWETNSIPADRSFSYIVEWSADCNNDGIVDYGQCRDGTLPDYNGNNVPDCCEQDGSCIGGDYPVQWREGDRANGHWYGVVRTPGLPWSQARAEAVSVGGDLASAPRAEVNAFIGRLIRPYSPWGPGYWLGGRKVDGEWAWVNGESWSFVSWGSAAVGCNNQPDGRDAVDIYCFDAAGVPRWSDDYFQWPNAVGFVIEWSADCNNDGIVDKGQILKGQLVDADANGVPDVCEDPCPGDITNGGTVDATDLSIVLAAWGTNGQGEFQADIDNSGLVDGGDLALVLGGWGPCPQ